MTCCATGTEPFDTVADGVTVFEQRVLVGLIAGEAI